MKKWPQGVFCRKNNVFLLSELFDIKPTKTAKNNAIFN